MHRVHAEGIQSETVFVVGPVCRPVGLPATPGVPSPLTVRALVAGILIGSLLCSSNMYFGLQTGWVTMGSLQVCSTLFFASDTRPYLLSLMSPNSNHNPSLPTCPSRRAAAWILIHAQTTRARNTMLQAANWLTVGILTTSPSTAKMALNEEKILMGVLDMFTS